MSCPISNLPLHTQDTVVPSALPPVVMLCHLSQDPRLSWSSIPPRCALSGLILVALVKVKKLAMLFAAQEAEAAAPLMSAGEAAGASGRRGESNPRPW